MSAQMSQQPNDKNNTRNGVIAGIGLMAIGALLIVAQFGQFENLALLIPLGLGVIFLAWGLITRIFGLIIPGGILSGIGVGVALTEMQTLGIPAANTDAIILLSFAAGWVLITLLSPLTNERWQWWPLIPGGILGAVGVLLLAGERGEQLLEWVGKVWPFGLIIAGIYLVYHFARQR